MVRHGLSGALEPHGVINNGADNTAPFALAKTIARRTNAMIASTADLAQELATAERRWSLRPFGAYHLETIALAREPSRVPAPGGSAAVSLEVFTREKIGVEGSTLADSFLLGVLRGRLRDNVVHFRSVRAAVDALKDGQLAAVLAPRGELDAALGTAPGIVVEDARYPELSIKQWPVGMAVKADAADLQAALTHALAELQADGTVAAIFRKHGVRQVNP